MVKHAFAKFATDFERISGLKFVSNGNQSPTFQMPDSTSNTTPTSNKRKRQIYDSEISPDDNNYSTSIQSKQYHIGGDDTFSFALNIDNDLNSITTLTSPTPLEPHQIQSEISPINSNSTSLNYHPLNVKPVHFTSPIIQNNNLLSKQLFNTSSMTTYESVMEILSFIVEAKLNKTQSQSFLNLLHKLLPPCNLPNKIYDLMDMVTDIEDKYFKVYFCEECESVSKHSQTICKCGEIFDINKFFYMIDFDKELSLKFNTLSYYEATKYYSHEYLRKKKSHDIMQEIYDGSTYQKQISAFTRIHNSEEINVSYIINNDGVAAHKSRTNDENFENYVHETFGTNSNKNNQSIVNRKPAISVFEDENIEKSTIEEQYLFGAEDEEPSMETNVNRNFEKRPSQQSNNQFSSPLKKRKLASQQLISNAGHTEVEDEEEDLANCSLVISPPPFDEEETSSAANNMLFGNDEENVSGPILEAGLYTGRSRDRKSRIKSSYYEPGSPLNTGLENNPSMIISSSPLLKYTVPSTESASNNNMLNDSITNRSSILNESLRERDDIIDQLNNEAEGERRKLKEYKLLIEKLQSENAHLKQQNSSIKKKNEEILIETEKENNTRELEIQSLKEKIAEQQTTINLQNLSKTQKESKFTRN
ncbi:predicted protein [Naegleria gruberi]|uniref:Predicted protein n=1 Tax=Naegleria gruberi TaxID=5762 RepID=D2W4M4_NAEGR|nr:uncharacterized protein NAEGRDRAFT_76358 [Naegleria gruberi]EFC35976.1 predicted protein [Naegleria gruberi]|eukprot:XP_002668720.1 predicted protein [Naegleria gruberi strain NEG-M]